MKIKNLYVAHDEAKRYTRAQIRSVLDEDVCLCLSMRVYIPIRRLVVDQVWDQLRDENYEDQSNIT